MRAGGGGGGGIDAETLGAMQRAGRYALGARGGGCGGSGGLLRLIDRGGFGGGGGACRAFGLERVYGFAGVADDRDVE